MKRTVGCLLCVLVLSLFPAALLSSEEKAPWLYIGPRIGLTGVLAAPEDFDGALD